MQIVARGDQDTYLTSSPVISFWKISYRRHTNFSMESIEQTFSGQADFGRSAICTISRSGDLAYHTYLQVTLPQIGQSLKNDTGAVYARWLDFPGHQLISSVELEIGGQRIEKHYGDFMHIWRQLTLSKNQERGYFKMIGNTTQLTYITDPSFADVDGPCDSSAPRQVCAPRNALPETTLYIPLMFFYNTHPGLALPLLALQYHEVKIRVEFRTIDECLWAVQSLDDATGANQRVDAAYAQSLVSASLYVDYIFLDNLERRKMVLLKHEYLFEQLQYVGDDSIGSSSNRIRLNFNHPCKELIWVVQPDAHVDYCASLLGGETLYKALGAQPFNYTDAVDALPNSIRAFGAEFNEQNDFIASDGMFADPDSVLVGGVSDVSAVAEPNYVYTTTNGAGLYSSSVSDAGTFVLAETALDMHCWGENPVVTAKLQLNGQDRFSEREGTYFDQVQPWQHHTRAPDTGINVYSFALRPEEHQPSGTCNMSRIDNASLQLVVSNATVAGAATAKVRVYTRNYNVLRIKGGMGGLTYSN